jgi:dTDP-4-dehydrorhamnose reductase
LGIYGKSKAAGETEIRDNLKEHIIIRTAWATQISEQRDITWGTYHYCGKGVTTWHGFAQAIFDLANQYDTFQVKKVVPITTAEYPTPAKRPANSGMDCSLITKNFGISLRPWQESLADMLNRYYR